MENKGKNGFLNTILISVCVFVGVGFISGAEIWFYFARFNINMIFGLVLFGGLCFLMVYYAQKSNNDSFEYGQIRKLRYFVTFSSELLIASAMISGIFYTSRMLFGGLWFIVDVASVSCLIYIFIKGFRMQKTHNYFVAIFIIFVIITLFLFNNKRFNLKQISKIGDLDVNTAIISSIFAVIYIFTNIATIRPVIENFNHQNKKKNKILFSISLSLILIFLIVTLTIFLWKNDSIANQSMPFLLLFNNYSLMIKWMFLVGLMMCLISTCVACLDGVYNKLNLVIFDTQFNTIIVILSSLIIAQIPFNFFVKIIYPVVGIFNFLLFGIEIFYSRQSC